MEQTVFLFKKIMKKEDKKWDTFFATSLDNNHSITVTLTETAKAQILTSGIDFPMQVTISDEDYFITNEKYENENGIEVFSNRCVIQSFSKIEKADIKKKTLSDVWGA